VGPGTQSEHDAPATTVGLGVIAREWGRLGCIGFGGPPTHIALLRDLCVERRRWLDADDFEDAIATCNLLPGPASTQLAILCAWRIRRSAGAIVGGLCFILPGLALILLLAAIFLATSPPLWVRGAAAGAGAAVAAVAVRAGVSLVEPSWRRAASARRWLCYAILGGACAALAGPWVVLALLACGLAEIGASRSSRELPALAVGLVPLATLTATVPALAWVSFKVGALSYGGGFVIIPLMQADAVSTHHWMSAAQFLDAVALGQITPGPVVLTVAVVGYAAAGVVGGVMAAAVAFSPSFAFVLLGARHFDRLRRSARVRAFLAGAGPAAIGAILGSAIPLAREIHHVWQVGVLAGAFASLFVLRRGVVATLLAAGVVGVAAALLGAATP
jgi:chromate transporter